MTTRRAGRLAGLAAIPAVLGLALTAETRVTHVELPPAVRLPMECLRDANPGRLAERIARTGIRIVLVPAWSGDFAHYRSTLAEPVVDLKPFRDALHRRNLQLYAVCPVFHDPEAADPEPGYVPLDQHGLPWTGPGALRDPLDPAFRALLAERLVETAKVLRPDAFVLDGVAWPNIGDALRGDPTAWDAGHPLYDFGESPVAAFLAAAGLTLPPHAAADPVVRNKWILGLQKDAWMQWRCGAIATLPAEMAAAVRQAVPETKFLVTVGPHLGDFGRRFSGQDAALLSRDMDAVILRAPHERLERGRPWIKLVVKEAVAAAGRPVWVELESTLEGRGGYDAIEDLEAVISDTVESGAGGLVFSDWRAFEDGRDPAAPRKRKVVHGLFR